MNIAAISKRMLRIHSVINKTYSLVKLCDSKQILDVGEEIYSNNKPRYKRLWKFVVLYGISRQPIVGTCHPAPTLFSIFLLCTLLAEHTQTCCSEREEARREKGGRGEERRGADTQ